MFKKYVHIPILITILITLVGCVSQKKYHEALESKRQLHEKSETLGIQVDDLQKEINRIDWKAQNDLNQKEAELVSKEMDLRQRGERLAELENLVNEQRDAVRALHQEVCSALKCFTPEQLNVEVRDGKLYVSLSDKLLFPSGSDEVNDRGKDAIGLLSSVITQSDLEIMIEGHTDTVPIHTNCLRDNWDLSVHRATNVTRIMIENGIEANRIIACGRGEFQPVAKNYTEDGRQSNRRTEIVLAPKLDRLWKLTESEDPVSMYESSHK